MATEGVSQVSRYAGLLRVACLCLIPLPALWTGYLIARYGVNVPKWDQWELVPLFEKAWSGTLSFADLFAQHNESRLVFTRLLFIGLARLSGWDVRWEMYASLVLVALTMLGIVALARKTAGQRRAVAPRQRHVELESDRAWTAAALLAVSVLLFSPVQAHNWVWGFQLGVFTPTLSLVAILLVAYSSWPLTVRVATCAAIALVATFSFTNGMLCWLLAPPALLLNSGRPGRQRTILGVLWIGLVALTLGVYLIGYEKPADHPSLLEAIHHPIRAAALVIVLTGAPLGIGLAGEMLTGALAAGALLLLLFALLVTYLLSRGGLRRRVTWRAGPWLILSAYAVISALMIAAGRVGYGAVYALSGRYMTFPVYFSASVLLLLRVVLVDMTSNRRVRLSRAKADALTAVAIVLVVAANLSSDRIGLANLESIRHGRHQSKAALQWVNVLPREDYLSSQLYPRMKQLRERAETLQALGLLRPGLLTAEEARSLIDDADAVDLRSGAMLSVRRESLTDTVLVEGWAYLPARRDIADAIVLAISDGTAQPRPIHLVLEHTPLTFSTWTAPAEIDPSLRALVTWSAELSPGQVPPGARLRAWAYDALERRATELSGAVVVP